MNKDAIHMADLESKFNSTYEKAKEVNRKVSEFKDKTVVAELPDYKKFLQEFESTI